MNKKRPRQNKSETATKISFDLAKNGQIDVWDDKARELLSELLGDQVQVIEEAPRPLHGKKVYCG